MRFNAQAFNTHLDNLGEYFLWRRSAACPCINPASGSPKAGCPHCFGKGRIWGEAIKAKAGIASQKTQLEWAKFGQWESGDLVLSIPENSPLYDIAQFDRVVATTSSDTFSIPLVRGAVNERIPGQIKEISRVFWFNQVGNIVEGGIPTVGANGVLSWPGGGSPPAGTTYSVTGERYNEYYCFGAFSNDRMKHGGMRLPRRMVLRAFDLFGR